MKRGAATLSTDGSQDTWAGQPCSLLPRDTMNSSSSGKITFPNSPSSSAKSRITSISDSLARRAVQAGDREPVRHHPPALRLTQLLSFALTAGGSVRGHVDQSL